MTWAVRVTAGVWAKKRSFIALVALVFVLSVAALARFDLLPEPPASVAAERPVDGGSELVHEPEYPVRITAAAIGLDVSVENPVSTTIAVLDDALLRGAVRYPTAARLGEEGNVVLFGHSSYLPVVVNRNFKAFNGIERLKPGDLVTVYGEGRVYEYRVGSVRRADALEDGIPLAISGKKLTLATCDSFGKKTDRFIVEADFVESWPFAGAEGR